MTDNNLVLFIMAVMTLGMMIFVFRGRSRATLIFLLLGMLLCMTAGEISGLIYRYSSLSFYKFTLFVTPVIEECLKAIPIVFAAVVHKPKRRHLLEYAFALGAGFALLENICLFYSMSAIDESYAVVRGLGAGLMHGVCTLVIGYAMTKRKRKISLTVLVTAVALVIVIAYHSLFNFLVQSSASYIGLLMPLLTFVPFLLFVNREFKEPKEERKKENENVA